MPQEPGPISNRLFADWIWPVQWPNRSALRTMSFWVLLVTSGRASSRLFIVIPKKSEYSDAQWITIREHLLGFRRIYDQLRLAAVLGAAAQWMTQRSVSLTCSLETATAY